MESFYHLCIGTTDKLGRKLREDELRFLQWMYKRYTMEQLETDLQKKDYNLCSMNS